MVRGMVVLSVSNLIAAALAPALERRHLEILVAPEDNPGVRYVEVVQCLEPSSPGWSRLRSAGDLNRVGTVAIVQSLRPEILRQVYSRGAAAISVDEDPAKAADVIAARLAGDVTVPAGLLRDLIAHSRDRLTPAELAIFSRVLGGETIERVAEDLHYSDRHVRRVLQGILAKAGTDSRDVAADYFAEDLGSSG